MINKIIEELFIKNGIEDIKVSKSNRPDLCDYQSNDIFKIAKKEGKSTIEVGKEVELKINDIKNFSDLSFKYSEKHSSENEFVFLK